MFDILILILGQFTYLMAIMMLVAGSFGVPIPEEAVLLILGYLAATSFISLLGAMLVGIIGIIIGDTIAYRIFLHGGRPFLAKWGSKIGLPLKRVEYIENKWEARRDQAVFLSRFMIGFRFLGPLVAGLTQMHWRRFFWLDFLSIIIWVPIMTLSGYFLSWHLEAVLTGLKFLKHYVFIIVVAVIALVVLWQVYQQNRDKYNNN